MWRTVNQFTFIAINENVLEPSTVKTGIEFSMCPLSHSYLYCYRFIVIHQSGTRKALFGTGLNNTKVYLNSFVVLLNIIQLQDKV
jgi:hypothetical protein